MNQLEDIETSLSAAEHDAPLPDTVFRLLRHHITEHQRALDLGTADRSARVKAFESTRSVVESARGARARARETERERFAGWLTAQRTRLLMASKADAIVALDRVLQRSPDRRTLHIVGSAAAIEIVRALLEPVADRMCAELANLIESSAKRLVGELEATMTELGAAFSTDVMAGVELVVMPTIDLAREPRPRTPAVGALLGRPQIQREARLELCFELEAASLQLIARVLEHHDELHAVIEARYGAALDAAVETCRRAAAFAAAAERDGSLASARVTVAAWRARLTASAHRRG